MHPRSCGCADAYHPSTHCAGIPGPHRASKRCQQPVQMGTKAQQQQREALFFMKQYTDFNDMETLSQFGFEGVSRQVGSAVSQAVHAFSFKNDKKNELSETKQQEQKLEHKPLVKITLRR